MRSTDLAERKCGFQHDSSTHMWCYLIDAKSNHLIMIFSSYLQKQNSFEWVAERQREVQRTVISLRGVCNSNVNWQVCWHSGEHLQNCEVHWGWWCESEHEINVYCFQSQFYPMMKLHGNHGDWPKDSTRHENRTEQPRTRAAQNNPEQLRTRADPPTRTTAMSVYTTGGGQQPFTEWTGSEHCEPSVRENAECGFERRGSDKRSECAALLD